MIAILNNWLNEAIKTQHDKIDACQANDLQDGKVRSEGYLEALIHMQNFLSDIIISGK